MGFTSPLFSLYASSNCWRVRFLVVPFPPCGLPLLGCLLAWTLVLAPYFFFSPFLGCLLFIEFGRVSSSRESDQAPRFQSIKFQWRMVRKCDI